MVTHWILTASVVLVIAIAITGVVIHRKRKAARKKKTNTGDIYPIW